VVLRWTGFFAGHQGKEHSEKECKGPPRNPCQQALTSSSLMHGCSPSVPFMHRNHPGPRKGPRDRKDRRLWREESPVQWKAHAVPSQSTPRFLESGFLISVQGLTFVGLCWVYAEVPSLSRPFEFPVSCRSVVWDAWSAVPGCRTNQNQPVCSQAKHPCPG